MIQTEQYGQTTYYCYEIDGRRVMSLTKLGLLDTLINYIALRG